MKLGCENHARIQMEIPPKEGVCKKMSEFNNRGEFLMSKLFALGASK
ncbi:hypothetical protein D068_cds01380 [Bacillus atrophaeus UCMB-5137]|nr:hypothetical protein D068_cds01380 [Bacillus atrophaeus UCMB-5137]